MFVVVFATEKSFVARNGFKRQKLAKECLESPSNLGPVVLKVFSGTNNGRVSGDSVSGVRVGWLTALCSLIRRTDLTEPLSPVKADGSMVSWIL